jgi:hypothetical protein
MKKVVVEKLITDNKMIKLGNTFVKPSQIKQIINEDADVYTNDGRLLLKFRKNKIDKKNTNNFYEATYNYTVSNTSKNRGNTSGSKNKSIRANEPIKSSIIGYFDKWAPNHKFFFKQNGIKTPLAVRETSFNSKYPEKMKRAEPLIKQIDKLYKQLLPEYYKKQIKKARQTEFKIAHTSFTTITTNINFKTSIHKDRGDDIDGFGNLTVIQRGEYSGGETCLPQYGIGVNVREGDILFMDVHEWHGNLPTKFATPSAVRMSIVCYLRTDIWKKTKDLPKNFKVRHLKSIKRIFGRTETKKKTRKKR